jgi:hypothetical protein
MNKISLTDDERESFHNANSILKLIMDSAEFKSIVKEIYGNDIKLATVKKELYIYDKIEMKLYKKPKAEKNTGEKKETHFTKKIEPTERSEKLWNLVKDFENLKIANIDQERTTSYSDIRTMVYSYIKNNNLRDQDRNIRVDDTLRELAPEYLGDVDYIDKADAISAIHKITKEIL